MNADARKHRIVSLLPSATEIVCELGLGDQLVGVTHECDYPPFVRDLPKVTRTFIPPNATSRDIDDLVRERLKTERSLYSLELSALQRLAPDLIVTQSLCHVCAVAESEVNAAACTLAIRPRIVNLEPISLPDVLVSLHTVAEAVGVAHSAAAPINRLRDRITAVATRSATLAVRPRVAFLEWIDPPFCAGHWTPDLISLAGGEEVVGKARQPSRSVSWDEIAAARPDVLVIGCCGFTVERTLQETPLLWQQPAFRNLPAVRNDRVYVVDGSAYFNRPGPRLVDGLEIVSHALHPQQHPLRDGLRAALKLSLLT